jgi:hypothetical protein
MNPAFEMYVGIDYSGAQTPTSSLKGLRVYEAHRLTVPQEVEPPPSPRKYWTRGGIAKWLVERLSEGSPTLVGIDHGFSFPMQYFEHHGLPLDWPSFLDDFHRHWPTDEAERANTRRELARVAAGVWQACGRERSSAPTPAAHAITEHPELPKIRVARRAKQRHFYRSGYRFWLSIHQDGRKQQFSCSGKVVGE